MEDEMPMLIADPEVEVTLRQNLSEHPTQPVTSDRTVVAQGRYYPAGDGVFAAIAVVTVSNETPLYDAGHAYATHLAVYDGERWSSVNGHYDLTWDEAVADLATR